MINFRGRFGNASRQQVDPVVGSEATCAVVPVEDIIGPFVGAADGVDFGLHGVSLQDRRVAGAEALDHLAVGLAVLQADPAAVKGRHDDAGAGGGEDEAGGVEWCDHAGIVPDSPPRSRG